MLISSDEILVTLGPNLKKARLERGYTQEFVAENVNISTDLLRNIENSRNIGSVPTLLNLCNFLEITPNTLFSGLYTTKEITFDTSLIEYFQKISDEERNILRQILMHIDKNY